MGWAENLRRAQAQQAKQNFGRAVLIGDKGAMPLDRFGNPLVPGAFVLFDMETDAVFKVESVEPVMDPRAPVGATKVVLSATIPLMLPARMPFQRLLVLSVAQEGGKKIVTGVDAGETRPDTDSRDMGSESAPASPEGSPNGNGHVGGRDTDAGGDAPRGGEAGSGDDPHDHELDRGGPSDGVLRAGSDDPRVGPEPVASPADGAAGVTLTDAEPVL